MIIARTKVELKDTLKNLSNRPGKLALIPTMGNLHDGHLSLIKLAKLKSSKTESKKIKECEIDIMKLPHHGSKATVPQ